MKILVTGGTGFVGKNLTQKLIELGHEVSVTSFSGERYPENISGVYSYDLAKIKDRFDVVFHQSANNDTRDMNVKNMFRSNLYDPIAMFHNLHNAGCVKFVYASSTAVYGNQPAPYTEFTKNEPLTPYAESKLAFDDFAMDFADKNDVSVIGLRYCNIYGCGEEHKGARMSMVSQIYQLAKSNNIIELFKYGNQRRDWVHVSDVVKANILKIYDFKSGIYNIGSGTSYSFIEVVDIIKNALGKDIQVRWVDCPYDEKSYQSFTMCDNTKASKELGYHPSVNLQEGIRRFSLIQQNHRMMANH